MAQPSHSEGMDIRGRGAVVTGASRGLGAALARELGRRGARVVLVARGEGELDAVVASIREAGGIAHGLAADVGAKDAILPLAGEIASLVGDVDLLVNNASTLGPVPLRLLADTACEDLERALAVNLVGPFRLTKALVGPMALRGRGLVVQLSSDAAVSPYPTWGAYSASKAALDHLTRVWAAELAPTGVRMLAVDPGEMDTRMHADAMPDADRATLARPDGVARTIADLVADDTIPTGTRLEAAAWEKARTR